MIWAKLNFFDGHRLLGITNKINLTTGVGVPADSGHHSAIIRQGRRYLQMGESRKADQEEVPTMGDRIHSLRNTLTGLASAAPNARELTVTRAIKAVADPATMKTQPDTDVR